MLLTPPANHVVPFHAKQVQIVNIALPLLDISQVLLTFEVYPTTLPPHTNNLSLAVTAEQLSNII